ncbi:MAG: caspase family protein [Polyangiaceae bacterium]
MTTNSASSQPAVPPSLRLAARTAKERLAALGGYALLIGLNDYDDPAIENLRGGRNDVLAYYKVCRKLGYKRVRMLTTPVLTEDEIVRAEIELAPVIAKNRKVTEEEIRANVRRWIEAGRAVSTETAPQEITIDGLTVRAVDKGARRVSDEVLLSLGEPTRQGMIEGLTWLTDRLQSLVQLRWTEEGEPRSRWGHWPSFPGFLVYSGHGARRGDDLCLCPSDTVAPGLEKAISFSEVRAILDRASDLDSQDPELLSALPMLKGLLGPDGQLPGWKHPADNLTVVLDCCFAGGAGGMDKAHQVPTITPGAILPRQGLSSERSLGDRVLCASARGEVAYQAMLGGQWHGAFSWALTTALEQWQFVKPKNAAFRRTDVSHAELLYRSRALLSALSFPQHPVLLDGAGNRPVFGHDSEELTGDEVAMEPTGERSGIQIDPLGDYEVTVFEVWISDWRIAEFVVPRVSSSDGQWEPTHEYWFPQGEFNTSTARGGLLCELRYYGYSYAELTRRSDLPPSAALKVPQATTWTDDTCKMDLTIFEPSFIPSIPPAFKLGFKGSYLPTERGRELKVQWFKSSTSSKENLSFGNVSGQLGGCVTTGWDARACSYSTESRVP